MSKVLTIDLDKEYRLKIESAEEIQNSFFKDVYKQAFEQVGNIVTWSKKSLEPSSNETFSREIREYNNIIAFTGERGTGKSSAMLTVANNLAENKESGIDLKLLDKKPYNYDTRFESLHTIDPSKFEKHQNIIEVILAELFESFNTLITDKNKQYNESEKREVLKAFQEVYKCLKIVSNTDPAKKFDGDALETLATLADATKLEKTLQDLISNYLKFIHPNKSENSSTLIIPIDDFDLNVKAAGQMAEQIRKYLMIPQVVVLMAINLEQFGDVKTQDVIGDFQTLFTRSNMSESPRDVAARYILKLIPIERRLAIPTLKIERNDVEFELIKKGVPIIKKAAELKFEEQIFNYIFTNTDLFLVSKREEYHIFLPYTLRELNTLLSVLGRFHKSELIDDTDNENCDKINASIRDIKNKIINIEILKYYLANTWFKNELLNPFVKMITNTTSVNLENWNKYFITSIVEILGQEKKYRNEWMSKFNESGIRIFKDNDELIQITDKNNVASNVSYGDLTYFIQFLQNYYLNDDEIKKLIFSVSIWYSIELTKSRLNYDMYMLMSEKEKNEFKPEFEMAKNTVRDLVNGTIINKDMDIIRSTKTSKSRIQFSLSIDPGRDFDKIFISHNILIKHDISEKNKKYRLKAQYVNRDIFIDRAFSNPTFNLFAFTTKTSENLFPFPYNNMEYWLSILTKLKRDYKSGANDPILVSYLFSQIFENIKDESYRKNLIEHQIIKLFLDKDGGFILDENKLGDFDDFYSKETNKDNILYIIKYIDSNKSIKTKSFIERIKKFKDSESIIKLINDKTSGKDRLTGDERKSLANDVRNLNK